MAINTVSKEFFEDKYRTDSDPWKFASSSYELNRYDEIIRSLGGRSFDAGFEPGCSIGVLTRRLASLCRRLWAMDISPTAVAAARQRCAHLRNVVIVPGALPNDMPAGDLDLIVFSEIGYYFAPDTLGKIRDRLIESLGPHGVLIGTHWLGVSPDHLLHGEEVHNVLRAGHTLRITASRRYNGFLLERWERIR
jgi:SAM-dependent methyltransferase